jgi:uncharacterized protein YceH (UPF0502 family)
VRLPRRPGQKEDRYAHTLGNEEPAEEGSATIPSAEDDRVAALERAVAELRDELAALRSELASRL